MPNITPTTAAKLIAEVWTKEMEKPFYSSLYFKDLVTRRDSLMSGGGNKLNIPFVTKYNAVDKVAGTPLTPQANTETEIELTINKHKALPFLIEDITDLQSNYNLKTLYREVAVESVSRAMDTDIASLHPSAGTNVAGGATIDDADILAVVQALDLADVPSTERVGIVHPKVMGDLRSINKYVAYDQTGKTGLAASDSARISSIYGMDIYMSTNVVDDATVTHNLFFHKKAISLAVQKKPTWVSEYSALDLGFIFVNHTVYGLAVERANALVDVERTS